MKITITFSKFCDMFYNCARQNQFSYEGKQALFDYLEEVDPDYDLDVVELCCGYTEYDSLSDFNEESGNSFESLDDLGAETVVIPVTNSGFIIANY